MKGAKRKATPEQEAQVCAWAAQARSISDWARKLGVCPTTVYNIIARGNGELTKYQRRKVRAAGAAL